MDDEFICEVKKKNRKKRRNNLRLQIDLCLLQTIHDDKYDYVLIECIIFRQQQQHHKLGARSASELEQLIMGCTSTDIKGVSFFSLFTLN